MFTNDIDMLDRFEEERDAILATMGLARLPFHGNHAFPYASTGLRKYILNAALRRATRGEAFECDECGIQCDNPDHDPNTMVPNGLPCWRSPGHKGRHSCPMCPDAFDVEFDK